jgi:hypothetical protein
MNIAFLSIRLLLAIAQNVLMLSLWHFHAIHTQVVIDNADYICYAEARGPLHFPKTVRFIQIDTQQLRYLQHNK